ncbi:MAG: glutamine synthetase family protein [Clostridia bacterium]|nr:glutamine synthetase family protein [Clostridia bacterium]
MKYTEQEVMQFVMEEDVKFIRLAFCDVRGEQKNVSIMPEELKRAFEHGISIDGSAIAGFGGGVHSDLFLHPVADTLSTLPWRPEHGRVVHMFCNVTYPDGRVFENDTRYILKQAIEEAKKAGYTFYFGAEMEFYLFKLDEEGEPTNTPYDKAGYMSIAPADKGENVRREICLTLEQMGIHPESSHHEEGPGQNEIDFRYSDALSAADNAITFRTVVRTIAALNGLHADFSPKPLKGAPGSGMHINMSVKDKAGNMPLQDMMAGVLDKIPEMTAFLNPCDASYERLGSHKAPYIISWSKENRSQLIRIPAAHGEYKRAELRSPDPSANPYLAFALMIYAGLHGIKNHLQLPEPADINLFTADEETLSHFRRLPATKPDAIAAAANSEFIRGCLPEMMIRTFCSI